MATTKEKQPEEPRKLDEAPQPGGVYIRDGQVVDAEGNILEGWSVDSNGNAVKAGAAPVAPKAESK
jgi:hypothetical protein